SRFAGARALEDVARVVEVVFDDAGEVGVSGSRTSDRFFLVLGAVGVFNGQRFGPVLPVLVLEQDRDRRSDGVGVTDAGNDLGAVGLDFHAAAAAVSLLTPPELMIDGVD